MRGVVYFALRSNAQLRASSWHELANLDAIADRLMFRNAYRRFADGHESMLNNYTVSANSVAGIRWFELRRTQPGNWVDFPAEHLSAGYHLALDGQYCVRITRATLRSALAHPAARLTRKSATQAGWRRIH